MHHDALLSNYGRGKSLVKFFSFGHNWVIVCACIQTPWNENRWMAIPIAFRLYRSKKRCPKAQYRKRTQLARETVAQVNTKLPQEREVILVGDTEYACREVVRPLPARIVFIGPMSMDAALYDPGTGATKTSPDPSRTKGEVQKRSPERSLLSWRSTPSSYSGTSPMALLERTLRVHVSERPGIAKKLNPPSATCSLRSGDI